MQNLKGIAIAFRRRVRETDKFTIFLVILCALSACLVLLRGINHGIGMSWDSMHYIAGANKLLEGNFFFAYPAIFPPLLSVLLASASFYVFDPRDVVGIVNATAFGLTVFVAGQWFRSCIKSRFLIIWGCLAVTFSIPLTFAASMASSEPVFVLLSTLALIKVDKFLTTNQQSQLVWAALFTALACMTRYAGITLIMTTVLLLGFQRDVRLYESVKRVITYLLISFAPLGLWLFRNFLITGTLTGNRNPSIAVVSETLGQVTEVVSRWAFPGLFSNRLETLVQKIFPYLPPGTLQVVAVVLGGIAFLVLVIAVGHTFVRLYSASKAWSNWSPFHTFGVFILVYLSFMTTIWLMFYIDRPNDRLLCPVYIPLLFVTVFALDRMMRFEREGRLLQTVNNWPGVRTILPGGSKVGSVCISIVLFLWLFQAVSLNAAIIQQSKTGKYAGYASPKWAYSETIRYLQAHKISGSLYSNVPPAIYFNAGSQKVAQFTLKAPPEIYSKAKGLRCFFLPPRWDKLVQRMKNENTAHDDTYIVWFHDNPSRASYDYDDQNISSLPYTEPVADLPDGIVYRVTE